MIANSIAGEPASSSRATTRRWLCRLGLWVGLPLLFLIAAYGTLVYMFFHEFYPSVPPPHFTSPHSVSEAQRQDLEYFRNYLQYNVTYSPAARGQAALLLEEYQRQAGHLTTAQFDLAIARMTALADNGHSTVYPDVYRRRHNRLPCALYHFSDGYYIVRARPACQGLLGARLLGIDGHPTAQIVDRMFQYVAGPRTHYDQDQSPFLLESPELLNAAGIAAAADHVTLRVLLQDGTEQDMPMSADPPEDSAERKLQWWVYSILDLNSKSIPATVSDWKSVLPADARLPLFLTDVTDPFRTASWPGIYYAAFRSNMSDPDHPIGPFVAGIKQAISTQKPRVVILDLRFDQGGDFTTTASLMSAITALTPSIAHVYVLISGWTFSAGETSVALAKEHGGDKVTLVGEPLGDRMRFWGEGSNLTLPNSGLVVHYATGMHDYSRPCRGQPSCFWTTMFFPMHVKTLVPDVTIPYTFADYRALRDPVLDYVLHAAGSPAVH